MIRISLLYFSALLLLLPVTGCKNDPAPAAANQIAATAPSAAAVKPEITLYAANVDNLLLRSEPTQKSTGIVAKLPEGAFVTGTGERSTNKEEAVLRGIPYTDVFLKVSPQADATQSGWAFAGALTPVYSGTQKDRPDLDRLGQVSAFFKTLDTKKLESGKKAWDYITANMDKAQGTTAEAAFILLQHFLFRMEIEGEFYKETEKVAWKDEDFTAIYKRTFDPKKYPQTQRFAENGFIMESGEGMVFPVVDFQRFQSFFDGKVGPAFKQYIDEEVLERRERDSDDGGLIIPIEKMAERAVFWEKFNQANPYFVLSDKTKMSEHWNRMVVISGMDNTPSYDFETKAILPEFKALWAGVQQKYPGTTLAAKCKEISDLAASEGWKYSSKVEAWVAKYHEESPM